MDKALLLEAINKFINNEPMTEEELAEFKAHILAFGLLKYMEDEVAENIRNATLENYRQIVNEYIIRCAAYALNIHYGI